MVYISLHNWAEIEYLNVVPPVPILLHYTHTQRMCKWIHNQSCAHTKCTRHDDSGSGSESQWCKVLDKMRGRLLWCQLGESCRVVNRTKAQWTKVKHKETTSREPRDVAQYTTLQAETTWLLSVLPFNLMSVTYSLTWVTHFLLTPTKHLLAFACVHFSSSLK